MISLADILPAMAVVGIKSKEKDVLKRVIVPCLIYIIIVGVIGFLVV
jgi:L-lactate permease